MSDRTIENPWITIECRHLNLFPNRLRTYLQEQYGQLGEDLIVEGLLKSVFANRGLRPEEVRYLEVGANHPIQTSNTYLLYHKWGGRGVLVEANPELIETLRRVRPGDRVINKAVMPESSSSHVILNIATNAELSSVDSGHLHSFGALGVIDRTIKIETVTLDFLLKEYFKADPHLLSIDIEGGDLAVLSQCSFARRPWIVVAEPSRHYYRNAEHAFLEVMRLKGYKEIARTDYNLIFIDPKVFV